MTWVLIWMITHTTAITSGSQEFNSQQACEAARDGFLHSGFRSARYHLLECVPKGEK